MNWRLLVYLSLFGLVMAIATLQFLPFNFELILWVFVAGFCAYSIGKSTPQQTFLNGFVLGIIMTIYLVAFRVAFMATYVSGHTEILGRFSNDVSQRMIIAALAVITGVVVGVITGGWAAFIAKNQAKA